MGNVLKTHKRKRCGSSTYTCGWLYSMIRLVSGEMQYKGKGCDHKECWQSQKRWRRQVPSQSPKQTKASDTLMHAFMDSVTVLGCLRFQRPHLSPETLNDLPFCQVSPMVRPLHDFCLVLSASLTIGLSARCCQSRKCDPWILMPTLFGVSVECR